MAYRSKTAAWILTSLSIYTCFQLFAHIRALRSRPIIITQDQLILCNGILGGDVIIQLDDIEKMEIPRQSLSGNDVIKLALIKGIEKPDLAIYLKHSIEVIKAFGIKKSANVILLKIDKQNEFLKSMESALITRKQNLKLEGNKIFLG